VVATELSRKAQPQRDEQRRRHALKMGDEAAEQCDDFGWTPTGAIDPTLVAKVAQQPGYGVGRAWSARATYDLSHAPNRIYLVHTVEGGFDFTVDGKTVTTEAGQLVLLDGDAPTTARTRAATARFVWHLTPTFLSPRRHRFRFHEPVSVNNATMQGVMALTNARLTQPDAGPASAHIGHALEHLIAGALQEAGTLHNSADALHGDDLFTAAQSVIEANFRDPAFDVNRLARELSSTIRHLHAAFRTFGTTPRQQIQERRLAEFERLAPHILTLKQAVERSGFSSIRQYTRAIAQQSEHTSN
jgi:AraC-like DNA-binding protein